MPETKIGVSQINKPAPLWYRRLSNGLIMFIVPALIGAVTSWGFSDNVTKKILIGLGLLPAVFKGLGAMLGNGQIYSPSNEAVDNAQPQEPKKTE